MGAAIVATMVWVGTKYQKRAPLLAVGLGIFLICLAPVSAWMSLQNLQADRYLLLPSAGLVVALGATFSVSALLRQHGVLVLAMGSIVMGVVTQNRCRDWHNTEALWRSAVEAQPGRVTGWSNLAGALLEERRGLEAQEVLEEGLAHHPNHPALNQSLCLVRYTTQSSPWTMAETNCRAALDGSNPNDCRQSPVYYFDSYGTASRGVGSFCPAGSLSARLRGRLDRTWSGVYAADLPSDAIGAFHRAWQINPYNAVTALRLAKASEMVGDVDGSLVWAQRALELEPDNPGALARIRKLNGR